MKSAKTLWIVTAIVETGAGVALLCMPAIVLRLLLGLESTSSEAQLVGRIGGAALVCIAISCWYARKDAGSPAQQGLLIGIWFYNLAAVGLLGWTGAVLNMAGIALWPGVVLHAVMTVWCSIVGLSGRHAANSASQP